MSAVDLDGPNVHPGITPTGERIVREIDGIGTLVFENYAAGEWLTKKGEPAKTSRRRYFLEPEIELDSVSSIGDALRKIGLEFWKEDMGARGAVQAERMGELVDVPEEDIIKRVRFLKLGADARAGQAADRGTAIHDAMHTLATEGRPANPAEFPGSARPWLQGATRAWLALNPTEILEAEQIVCDPELGYAGRPDLLAVCDGQVTVIDYKSSSKGEVYDTAHWTTRLYAMAVTRSLGIEVERVVLVGISDDGGMELIDCAISEDDARALVTVHRARKRTNASMAEQRKIARALANG